MSRCEPPSPHTLHCIRARAVGAYGFYATLSDSSVESFGADWIMSGLRAIHAQYLADMTAVGCDAHGGWMPVSDSLPSVQDILSDSLTVSRDAAQDAHSNAALHAGTRNAPFPE
jgi:hypothetical protein